MRLPESWSSTFSGTTTQAVLAHRPGQLRLDKAFALIEGHLEKTLNRLQFLAETNLPLNHFTIILELDRQYLGSEIGHFRAFCSLELVEPRERVVGLLFGSTDNPDRMTVNDVSELNLALGGIERGTCGRQWKEKLREGANVPDPFEKTNEVLVPAGNFSGVGSRSVGRMPIQFRDNEYEIDKYSKSMFRTDSLGDDFRIPMCFADSELADAWVCVSADRSSSFHISFSDSTPRRRFSAIEVGANEEPM